MVCSISRITSKIKKFTEAHKRLSRLQDEVKRYPLAVEIIFSFFRLFLVSPLLILSMFSFLSPLTSIKDSVEILYSYRSDVQLQKLGEKLCSSAIASGDDLSMNITTDGEAVGIYPTTYGGMKKNMSPHKKRSRVNLEAVEAPDQGRHESKWLLNIYIDAYKQISVKFLW